MSWVYRHVVRPFLFTQDPEWIHDRTMRALGWSSRHALICNAVKAIFGAPPLPIKLFGLSFPNPVGLAAGMDKHAEALPAWSALGFGFSELGAVTWHPQPGNPSPRVFRVVAEQALINRLGFNNPGAEALAQALAEWRAEELWPAHPVGINLGKSRITPLAQAAQDYAKSFQTLWPYLDFFVVNVSSPNTPNLRQLQDKSALDDILAALQEVQTEAVAKGSIREPRDRIVPAENGRPSNASATLQVPRLAPKPVLVKVSPDLSFEALDEILELVGPRQVAGIIATNTTIVRPPEQKPELQRIYAQEGGLSGNPLRDQSTRVVRHLYRQSHGSLPIIGVGGIFTAADAWEKIAAGASLVQLYTGLVFEGPGAVKAIVTGLIERLERSGLGSLRLAIGTESNHS
ncbi:Dihydroorotate dehydrogenase (quinone) [Verrucomicrobia bacterium]|nr:Dihydroorotate dehydrogenase (quinone) [Verrucomicrobiota bacterium]